MAEETHKGGIADPGEEVFNALTRLEEEGQSLPKGNENHVGGSSQSGAVSTQETRSPDDMKELADRFNAKLAEQEGRPHEDVEIRGIQTQFDALVKKSEEQRTADLAATRAHLDSIPNTPSAVSPVEGGAAPAIDSDLGEATLVYRSAVAGEGAKDSLEDLLGGVITEDTFAREDGIAMVGREIRGIQQVLRELIEGAVQSGDQREIDKALEEAAEYRKKQEELALGVEGAKDKFPKVAAPVLVDIDTFRAEFAGLVAKAKRDPSSFGLK